MTYFSRRIFPHTESNFGPNAWFTAGVCDCDVCLSPTHSEISIRCKARVYCYRFELSSSMLGAFFLFLPYLPPCANYVFVCCLFESEMENDDKNVAWFWQIVEDDIYVVYFYNYWNGVTNVICNSNKWHLMYHMRFDRRRHLHTDSSYSRTHPTPCTTIYFDTCR